MGRRAGVILASVVLVSACSGSPAGLSTTEASRVVATVASAAASTPAAAGLPDDAVVTYAFHDASVPPQFHRSETLTVDRRHTHLVIDSYGTVLADRTLDTPPDVWSGLGLTLGDVASLSVTDHPQGCTGGTAIGLTVEAGGTSLVDLAPEFCAGSNAGLDSAIDGWVAPARALFPATEELAPT